jgi:hypothetical protein
MIEDKKMNKLKKLDEIKPGSIYGGNRIIKGKDAIQFLAEKSADLEQLREEIEERLENMESILNECQRQIPELGQLHTRARAYWLGAVGGMMRSEGSMVNFEDSIKEISDVIADLEGQEENADTPLPDIETAEDDEAFEEHERQVFRDVGLNDEEEK